MKRFDPAAETKAAAAQVAQPRLTSAPQSTTMSGTETASAAPALRLPLPVLWLVLVALLGAVLLNLHHTAIWCAPLALIAVAWRARSGSAPTTPRGLSVARIIVVFILTAAALFSFRGHGSLGAAATLLVVMAALKLSETTRLRDWLIVMGAALFLLLAACLDQQSLWRLPLYVLELWLLCTALYALGAGDPAPTLLALLKGSARSLAAALPLAVLLFLFFPRLSGSFYGLPQQGLSLTGIGDEMSPGNITDLVQSEEPAMHVRFDGDLPPAFERYWRGPVLHDFDGFTWRRRRGFIGQAPRLQSSGPGYRYEVTLEPNLRDVLFALELPSGPPESIASSFTSFDYQLIANRPLVRTVNYTLTSHPAHRSIEPLPDSARRVELRLPPRRNPRTLELAKRLRSGARDDAAYVAAVLDYLHRGGFRYTLEPAALGIDSVDDLLFRTHEGFCEHYASAFATLMRAGGVPARVVTGYLGGEWNRFGHYLLIRQSDAHAWTEVWLDGKGWTRVDPTSVVSPSSLGLEFNGLSSSLLAGGPRLEDEPWIKVPVQAWQAMNAWWQDTVVSFNFNKQLGLLDSIGLGEHQWHALVGLLAVGGALWLVLIAWGLRPRSWQQRQDQLTGSWQLLERKLGPGVAARAPYEGPLAYAQRIGREHPVVARRLHIFARRFAQLRYGPTPTARELAHFRRAVRQWQPLHPTEEESGHLDRRRGDPRL